MRSCPQKPPSELKKSLWDLFNKRKVSGYKEWNLKSRQIREESLPTKIELSINGTNLGRMPALLDNGSDRCMLPKTVFGKLPKHSYNLHNLVQPIRVLGYDHGMADAKTEEIHQIATVNCQLHTAAGPLRLKHVPFLVSNHG